MNKNYFELLCEVVGVEIKDPKISVVKKDSDTVIFTAESRIYEIKRDCDKAMVDLSIISEEDGDNKTIVSSWLLNEESATQKDIQYIARDFAEIIGGKGKKQLKQAKKKPSSNDESNVTGLFFANRMMNIFPELKNEIQKEKEISDEFRTAYFTREKILPQILELLKDEKEKSRTSKLFKMLGEFYQNGTLDVRSVITMVILNNIEGEKNISRVQSIISSDLKKAWDAALKYKGKTVKPEKPKKKSSFMSKILSAQQ